MKKIILLTTLCLSLATGTAFAQNYGGGSGTESDPFLISSRAHMEELATTVNGGTTYAGYHFKLTADLTGITTIIGNTSTFFFSGIFDGDGHTIELNINTSGAYAGVFGYLSGATIKNTKVSGKVVSSSSSGSYAGGICGGANNSTISNCNNAGDISASTSAGGICGGGGTISNCNNTGSISATNAGGICGGSGTISNCSNMGNISASASAGGICGNGGTVSNCNNTGTISSSPSSSSSSYVGGICGKDGTVISNCYNMGNISSSSSSNTSISSYAGGICGGAINFSTIISNCYNKGNISAYPPSSYHYSSSSSYTGGICGYATNNITISKCYNEGSISASSSAPSSPSSSSSLAGGICGYAAHSIPISNCYNTGPVSSSSSYPFVAVSSSSSSTAGGICGSGGTISKCYNKGNIFASSPSSSSISSTSYARAHGIGSGNISNCFAANATITASGYNNSAGRIGGGQNCYALISMKINGEERNSMNADSYDGADGVEVDFKNESWLMSILDWDFETVWTISGTSGWPVLKDMGEPTGNIFLEIEPLTLDFTAAGETQSVTVTSNVSWTAGSDDEWIAVTPPSGSNDGTISVTATANTAMDSRTGTVTVSGGGIEQTVSITQEADVPTLTVSPATLDFTASGETKSVTVTSNVSWTAGSDDEWIAVTPPSGSNDGTISVTATANTAMDPRTGTVTVSGGGIEQTVSITQEADVPTLTVSPAILDFAASGETKSVTVTSNVSWTVDSDDEWIAVTPPSGSNDGTISVTATENTTMDPRTGTVTVVGGDITQTVSIMQAASVPMLIVSPATLDFIASGETKSVIVTSNLSWIVDSDVEWITVTPSMDSNNEDISVTAAANTTIEQRTGTITVIGSGGIRQTVSITQAACIPPPVNTLTVSPTMLNFTVSGETQPVTVASNVNWTVDRDVEWITVTPSSGSNDDAISVTAEANITASQRTGFVVVTGGGFMRVIAVTQTADGTALTVSPATLDFTASGETKSVTVTSDVSWTVDSDAEWITVTPSLGSNDGVISVTAEANMETGQRTGIVTVSGGGIEQTVSITQATSLSSTNTLTVSPAMLNFTASGETRPVTVTSNVNWTVDRDAEWITVTPLSGSDDDAISVTAEANTTADQRTGFVVVTGGGIMRVITVTQATDVPSTNTLTVSPVTLDFTASGETQPVTITSNVSWTVEKDAGWITVTPESGSNDGAISVTAAAMTASYRTGTVTVTGGGITHTVAVTQTVDGITLTVSAATLDFTASGEPQSVTVTSNVSWIAGSDAGWITVTPESGSNDGVISVTAEANTTTSERTGTVTVSGGGITRTITVMQAADGTAPSPTLTVSATDIEIAAEGGSQDVTIQSNTSWTVVSSEAWASVSPASGTNDGAISITAAANSTENTRTATITVSGGGLTCIVTVTQEPDRVDNAPVDVTDVRYFNSRLYVNTPVAERVAVYSIDGMMMYQSQKQPGIATFDLHSLPRGVLIVRGDSGWVKKIVR